MGCIFPTGDAITASIDREQRNNENKDGQKIKLLFLGAGGSGKSTLFKQLRLLYGDGLTVDLRRGYTNNIYNNIITGLKALVDFNLENVGDDDKENDEISNGRRSKIKPCDEEIERIIQQITEDDNFTPETAKLVQMVWADPGIQSTWANRGQLQVQDSLQYFVENVDRIGKPNYIPNKDDVLHVRAVTTGIVEEDMEIEKRMFHIVDVGGQRSERRKWISCFDDVTGLIFVVSLISYNQTLYEDEETNRMKESLSLFRKTLKGKDGANFEKSSIVLFLNKDDLFQKMIKTHPITTCFPKYKGELTEEAQYNYIKQRYLAMVAPRKIFVHRTCATNTEHIEVIFNVVNIGIIKRAFENAGLWMA